MKQNRLFVPRLMDATQLNAQNSNTRNMLRRWSCRSTEVTTLTYNEADHAVVGRQDIRLIRLRRGRLWRAHLFFSYFRRYDGIFYPGVHALSDLAALRVRRLVGLRCPVIGTLEGLVGDQTLEFEYSRVAGHPVFCHDVGPSVQRHVDALIGHCDHVIAISPLLAKLGRFRYGDKFSVLPLGVDLGIFHPAASIQNSERVVIVAAGRLSAHKRPDLFLKMAGQFPEAEFRWFGDGELKRVLEIKAEALGIQNLKFPGAKKPHALAEEFRKADIFVITSRSEGVPKVSQEAASCGLPIVLFGFYESPTVVDGVNGCVVWSDEEMVAALRNLINDRQRRSLLGRNGFEISKQWDWSVIAPQWEHKIWSLVSS